MTTNFTALQWFRVVESQWSSSWTSTHYDDKLHCTLTIKLMDKLLLICNRQQLWYSCFNIHNNNRLHCTSITVISLSDKLNFIRFPMMTGSTALQQPCVDHHQTNEQSSSGLQKTSTSSNTNTHWWQTSLHFSDLVSAINKLPQLMNRSSSASVIPVFLYYLHTLRIINVGHQFNNVERHNSNFSSMRNWTSALDGYQS